MEKTKTFSDEKCIDKYETIFPPMSIIPPNCLFILCIWFGWSHDNNPEVNLYVIPAKKLYNYEKHKVKFHFKKRRCGQARNFLTTTNTKIPSKYIFYKPATEQSNIYDTICQLCFQEN